MRHLTLVPRPPPACDCPNEVSLDDLGNVVCYVCRIIIMTSDQLAEDTGT